MRASEILRKLADVIDQHTGGEEQARPENSVPHAELAPVEVDHTDATEPTAMVPPLQQKLELLKQAVQGEQETCPICGATECECEGPDELNIIKQNAGLPVIVAHTAGEDNDIGD